GQYQDATVGGDYFMRARMYDAGTGTFNSMDPVATGVGQPAVSPYAYVSGRVLRSIDPTGESLGSWIEDRASMLGDTVSDMSSEAFQWGKETVTGAGETWELLDDASPTSVGTPKATREAVDKKLKEQFNPKNMWEGFKAGYEEDKGNPTRQITRGFLDGASVLLGGAGAAKAGATGARAGGVGAKAGTAGCRNSFVPGTAVLMADGSSKAIEAVQIGDLVQAAQPETGETGARPVSALITGDGAKRLVDITIDTDGAAGEQTGKLTATDEHPVWVANTRTWTNAANLKAGDQVLTNDGTASTVLTVSTRTKEQQVHNLTVAGLHTYYVIAGNTPGPRAQLPWQCE
ncbi:MAG TPA: polymorphic toxin-type HINT domain-containing protein, partial [Micromonosporaceae bacterium]|nr:polymorphic toxin-type HINT domain-containing protein [Micromonosporaceae bacterium]